MSETAKLTPRYIDSEKGLHKVYSNNFLINWTAYDIRMKFGQLKHAADGEYVIEHDVAVFMSWTEAKELLNVLGTLIVEFEKLNGPITMPMVPQTPTT